MEKYYTINELWNPSLPNKRSVFVCDCRCKHNLLLKFMKDSKY